MVDFADVVARAHAVRGRYAELEQARYGREWSTEELMLGFVKDVGDLALLVQAKEGVRDVADLDAKLAHELADCLWSLIVVAECYGIDLEQAFAETMDDIEARLA
jgi:NTP pyrophosphatase (non-canonical NTP hydrolase)